MIDVFFRLYNPSPPDPRRPLHMLYIYIMTFKCPKDILGLGGGGGGGASKNKLKDTSFIFSMTNITILSIISYACAEGTLQSFGNEWHLYP